MNVLITEINVGLLDNIMFVSQLYNGWAIVPCTNEFRYLKHQVYWIYFKDDADIKREIRNTYIGTNSLMRKQIWKLLNQCKITSL